MNILVATVTAGAGHLQAAAALEAAWRQMRPRDQVSKLDVLEFAPKLYRKAYVQGYVKLVERAPELWGLIFDRTDSAAFARRITRLRRRLATLPTARFCREVARFKPQVALCTHYMPLEIMGRLKAGSPAGTGPFTVSVVTDFEAHALWMEPTVDLYCVAAEETKARLVARGAAPDTVAVTGIPVRPQFAIPVDAAAVRKQAGLRDDLPVVLVLSGGFGMGPVAGVLDALNRLKTTVQAVVVCGRNEELRRELATVERRQPVHVLGFVTNMHEWMAAADLIITKPGGLTSSEALALGKPMVVVNPIPGQESANSDFLLEHGAAIRINRMEDLPFRLGQLLGSARLRQMAEAARALGHPESATAVCQRVLSELPSAR
jgi:processive 1,2-diacylglycerol beta-glucosyltransferase